MGFTHGLIPHGHESNNHNHSHHEHDSENELGDHDHVEHNNHFDENIYDLFLCVLSDLEHGEHECSVEHNTKTNYRLLTNKNTIISAQNPTRFRDLDLSISETLPYNVNVLYPSVSCFYATQSRRGPPLA